MTIASLIFGTLIGQILFVITKVFFFNYLNIDLLPVKIAYFLALIIISIAVVRRMGILNYLESVFLAVVWAVALLITDFVITASLIGGDMFTDFYYWISNLAIVLSVIVFHKALHVQVRKANVNK